MVPLSQSRRNRALGLWKETGKVLGVSETSEPPQSYIQVQKYLTQNGRTPETTITVGAPQFSINVNVQSDDPQDVIKVIKAQIPGLTDEITQQIARALAQSFANTPIKS